MALTGAAADSAAGADTTDETVGAADGSEPPPVNAAMALATPATALTAAATTPQTITGDRRSASAGPGADGAPIGSP
ncbi:hypothetical protein ACFQ0T_33365 [Kitasatospora gansuensis]